MSVEVDLPTQPLINSVNNAVKALDTLDKAVGNLGKGKSSIDILRSAFKELETDGNASVRAMVASGNQAVAELERLNKRQTSLKGLLGRVEGTKGALKPESLITFRKEYEFNAALLEKTAKGLSGTLKSIHENLALRASSNQAVQGLKSELEELEAAAKSTARHVKPLREVVEGKPLSATQLYRANVGVQDYRSGKDLSAEHLYRANAGVQKLLADMAAEDTKAFQERGREKLAQIRQDNAQAVQAHKAAGAAERSALNQENALTLAMISGEGKAFQERGREKLAQIRQDASEVLKAHRDAGAAERRALAEAQKLAAAGDKELASIRNRLAAGKKIKLDLDLSAFDKPAPKLDLPDPKKVDGVTGSFDKLSRVLWDSHSAVRGLASGFGLLWLTWGNTLPLLAGAIASFSVVKSFKVGTELERSMFEIVNLAGLGAAEAGKLKETLLDLGKTSTYTATQAAEAAKILSLAGLKGAEVQAALVPTLRFASSGGVTMERAAEVLTSVGEAYAFSANAYSTVSDIIVKASSDSIASVEDMAEAFKTSSVLAQSYGVSLTDTAFALESLANIGIKGSAAGTSYRNFITELTKADGKAGAMMKSIGVTALDSTGRMRPLLEVTRDLTAATINMSGAEQRRVQDALANERGGKLYAATQAALSKELKASQQATLAEADAVQASGKIKEAQALRVKAVANAYEILAKRQKESVDNAAGLTFFAELEKKIATGGMSQGIQASLSSQLSAAFDAAQPALNSFALALREVINSEQFKNDLTAITTTLVDLGKAALDGAKWLYEHKEAVLLAGAAYVGLPAVIAAITAGIGFWTGGMVTLTASITAAKIAAISSFQQIGAVLAGITSSIGAVATFNALSATAMTAAVVALGVAVAVAAATVAAAGVAYLLYGDSVEAATRKAMEAEIRLTKDKAKSIEAQIKLTNDNLSAEIEGTKASIKEKQKGAAASEVATRVMGAQAIARVNAYWDEIRVLARKNLELEKHNILLKGGDWYQVADAEDRYNKQAINDLQDRNRAVSSLEGRISTLVKLKRQEAKLDMDASERNRKHEQGVGKGPKSADKFGQRAPYQDLKDFTSNVAALGKAELDALKNSRTAMLAELKDYHDAGIISAGAYQAQVISVTEAGYKAEAAKLKENLDRELDELDAYRSRVIKNDKLSAEDKFNRLQDLSTKRLAIEAHNSTDLARLRQEADDAERNAAIKQAKDLLEIRKKTEEAVAASMDRREALREESEVANRTAGLAGPELDAVHARLKVELQGRKDLRRIDIAAAEERTKAAELLASYEQDLDAESAAKKWEAYLATNDKINALLSGRSRLEKALGDEAAEAYAHAYNKAFKKIADEIAESLSSGITDALFTGGKEGWKKLRDTLKKELLMKPFQMVVKAIIQPVAQGMANVVTSALYGGNGGGGGGLGGFSNLFTSGSGGGMYSNFATSSFGQTLGLSEIGHGWYGAEVGLTSLGETVGGLASGLGAAMPYIGAIASVVSLLSSMDDSGTIHTGGLAQYSATGGLSTSTQHGAFGMGFGGVDFGQQGTDLASNMAKSVVGILDSTATAFGKTAGYTAATAFADDTSKDGAWGGLLIKKLGETVLNWDDARTSRWAPKEFADGEAGAKEYAAAVAKDVRNVLMEQTPEWADTMLNALGEAPTLDQLAQVVAQITQAQNALLGMGKASAAFASLSEKNTSALLGGLGGAEAGASLLSGYYSEFYSQAERSAVATANVTDQFRVLGQELPTSRDEFRKLVDAAVEAGNMDLASGLLRLAPAMAALTAEAAELQNRLDAVTLNSAQQTVKKMGEMSEVNRALFYTVSLLEEEAPLRERLNEVMMTEAELIAKKREAILPANQALFDMVTALESLSEAAKSVKSVEDSLANARESAAEATESVRQSIRDYIKDLTQSRAATASPTDALKYARENYINDLRLAKSGDTEAAKRITDSADKYIEAQKGMTASSVATQSVIDQVLAEMRGLESLPGLAVTGDTETTRLLKELKLAIEKMSLSISDAIHFDLVGKLGEIDLNRDMAISKEEFTAAFSHLASESSLNKVFTTLDLDGDAQISKLEAIVGNTNATALAIAGLSTAITQLQAGTITSAQAAAQISGLTQVKGATAAGTAITANTGGTVNTATGPQDVYVSSGGAVAVGDTIYGTSGTVIAVQDAISNVKKALAAGDPYSVYYAARADGVSAAGLDAMMGWAPGTSNNWAESVGLQAFAKGGAFTNGIVSEPTRFDMGLMGEAGPEAIMPLTRMANGALGVAYSGQQGNAEMVAELKALRAELADLKAATAAGVRVAQAVGKAQIEQLEHIADATADSAQTNKMMELAR